MKAIIAFLIFFAIVCSCQSRISKERAKKNLVEQARQASLLVQKGDFAAFVNYVYPPAIQKIGGRNAAIEMMKKSMGDSIAAKGMEYVGSNFGEPSEFIETDQGELQTIIEEDTKISFQDSSYSLKGTMICFSSDKGKHWTFLDMGENTIPQLRQDYPAISSKIKVGKGQ